MQYRLLLVFTIIVFITGCGFGKNDKELSKKTILGSWRLFDVETNSTGNLKSEEKLLAEADDHELVKQGMVISFFKDGSYTELWGSGIYRTGKWSYSSKEKQLSISDSGKTVAFSIVQEFINKKQTISLSPASTSKKLKLKKDAEALDEADEDPLYFKNNTWRTKATQVETHDQLVSRLGNYFRHILYILKSSKDRKQDIVSFEFSQGPVRIYNGGIGIIPYGSVSKNWINTYYNEENAEEAYLAFEKYLATSSYRGAGIGNWIEDDYNILLSIYGDTKKR